MRLKLQLWLVAVVTATGITARADDHAAQSRTPKPTHHQARMAQRRHAEPWPRPRVEPYERNRVRWIEPRHERFHPIERQESVTPTAVCTDGESSFAIDHRVACAGHGGVVRWLDQ